MGFAAFLKDIAKQEPGGIGAYVYSGVFHGWVEIHSVKVDVRMCRCADMQMLLRFNFTALNVWFLHK